MACQRFKITIAGFNHEAPVVYTVATLLGRDKAIAMAAQAHALSEDDRWLYDVQVAELTGDRPEEADLIDRMEW